MNKEIEKPQGRERALRYGLEIDRVPSRSDRDFTIEAASRCAGRLADPAERAPHLREEAADLQSRSAPARDSAALNNLAVAYSNCDLSVLSVSRYKKAFELGATLSASNLGYKYLATGLADEAKKLLQEAQAKEGCVPEVDRCLAAVTEKEAKETGEERARLEIARKHQEFLLCFGAAFISADTPPLDGRWGFSFGEISLKLSDTKLTGTAERTLEIQLSAYLLGLGGLGGSREPSKEIERLQFEGIVRGRTCKFEVKKDRRPQTGGPTVALASLLGDSQTVLEGYIAFAGDGDSGEVAEFSGGKPKTYSRIEKLRS